MRGMKIVLFVLCVAFISGCVKQRVQQKPTLRVVMGLTEEEWQVMRKKIFPVFEERYGCSVEAYQVEAADWIKKLEAMVGAKRVDIDVFSQDNMVLSALVKNQLVEDLSEYVSQIPDGVIQGMRTVGVFEGKTYFLPYRPNVQITYYNETKFNTYGLRLPQTWDELLDVAKTFEEKEGIGRVGMKLWGSGPTTAQVYEIIVSAGGDPFQFNDEGCIEAFQFLQTLYPFLSSDSKKAKWDTTNTYLANESFYLAQNWPFGINIIVKEYGKEHIKAYSGWRGPARKAHVIGGEVLGIPRGAPHRELAAQFIFFLQSQEVQEELVALLGWPSIRSDVYTDVATWQKPYFAAVDEALRHGIYRRNVLYWGEFDKLLNEAVTRIVIKQHAVMPVLNECHRTMQDIIKSYASQTDN